MLEYREEENTNLLKVNYMIYWNKEKKKERRKMMHNKAKVKKWSFDNRKNTIIQQAVGPFSSYILLYTKIKFLCSL